MRGGHLATGELLPFWGLLAGLLVLKAAGEAGGDLIKHYLGFTIVKRIRQAVALRLKSFSLGFFSSERLGEISTIVHKDVDAMEGVVAHIWTRMYAGVAVSLILGTLLFLLNWRMGLVMIIPVPLALLVLRGGTKKNAKLYKGNRNLMVDMVSRFLEYARGLAVLKSFQADHSFEDRLDRAVLGYKKSSTVLASSLTLITGSFQLILEAGLFLIAFYGLYLIRGNGLSLFGYLLFIVFSVEFYKPFFKAEEYWIHYISVRESYRRILRITDHPVLKDEGTLSLNSDTSLAFNQVVFGYGEGGFGLKDVDFTVPRGTMTALVGPSGAGKSTITDLLLRFYDPEEGSLTIGGRDIRSIPYDELLENISVVMQDVDLFSGTIYENLMVANRHATPQMVESAARRAMIHDFISSLPEGYNTVRGEVGLGLSGGQRQRLSIARAILKDADIIILDEATSSVDPLNERMIQKAISNLAKGRTLLVVAHHLHTIRNADQIVVLEDGKISGKGYHRELLESHDLYRSLWCAQADTLFSAEPEELPLPV
jgi:ATP-binding cassette subfamily B protein